LISETLITCSVGVLSLVIEDGLPQRNLLVGANCSALETR